MTSFASVFDIQIFLDFFVNIGVVGGDYCYLQVDGAINDI